LTSLFPACEPRIIVAAAQNTHNFPHDRGIGHKKMRKLTLLAAVFLACAAAFGLAGSQAGDPSASPTGQILSHDGHDGLTISADPYIDVERAKKKFGKGNPIPAGILPVEVFLRNETNQPIRIDLTTIQLEVRPPESKRQDVDSLTALEVATAIVHPQGPAAPGTRRFPPIGIPSSGNDKKVANMADILRPLSLDADIVPPMGMVHGFLFFNLSHEMSLADNASLFVPDVMTVPSNKPMMFFEVAFGPKQER
jgi:hypothetical protein